MLETAMNGPFSFLIALTGMAIVCGCQSPGVVQLSEDTYMVSRSSAAGAFANTSKLKADIIREANAFARSKGKVAVPMGAHEARPAVGFPSFEYQFRLVDKNHPEAKGVALRPGPDLIIEKNEKVSADVRIKDDSAKQPDFYLELTKLDDLRKKGIITEAEFEAEKRKLLSRPR
jgi:hypothetical protein